MRRDRRVVIEDRDRVMAALRQINGELKIHGANIGKRPRISESLKRTLTNLTIERDRLVGELQEIERELAALGRPLKLPQYFMTVAEAVLPRETYEKIVERALLLKATKERS